MKFDVSERKALFLRVKAPNNCIGGGENPVPHFREAEGDDPRLDAFAHFPDTRVVTVENREVVAGLSFEDSLLSMAVIGKRRIAV